MSELASCTIISKNYLSYARVFTNSFLQHHPGGKVFVLLVDRLEGYFDPAHEKFSLVYLEELGIPDLASFCFKYNLVELNTAVKPFFLSFLFTKFGFSKIAYFDPDILICERLDRLSELLNQHSIVLVPHLTDPIDDFDEKPNEIYILKAGVYNLGFIALSKGPTCERFLSWWQKRLFHLAFHRQESGLFLDQKWIDLVPGLFKDVFILTEPGYNVAYWNLHGRLISRDSQGRYRVNGEPLYFFHFSGFEPHRPAILSKYQTRIDFKDQALLRELFDHYCELQLQSGYDEIRRWPYAFGFFDNGVGVPEFIRRFYHSLGDTARKFGDPFHTQGDHSFFLWLTSPRKRHLSGACLSHLHYEIYRSSSHLLRAYPDVFGKDFYAYAAWLIQSAQALYQLDSVFLASLQPLFKGQPVRPSFRTRIRILLNKRKRWIPYLKTELVLKRLMGERVFFSLESFLRRLFFGTWHVPGKLQYFMGPGYSIPPVKDVGLNISGYITTESGIAEGVRANIKAAKGAGIPYALNNFSLNPYRKEDHTYETELIEENPYDVNLIQVNADQVPAFYQERGPEYFKGKYNIGYWAWELSTFPAEWYDRFGYFHEIWTYSSFTQDTLSKVSPIPVLKMPPAIEVDIAQKFSRRHFGFAEDLFIFFFMFDFFGVFERKNPLALVKAFQTAFPSNESVLLALKFNNSWANPQARDELYRAASGPSFKLIDACFSRGELYDLLNCCNAYVSLHRSEGFGITMAEAMYLGKPVIATAYSANMDFMNSHNSFPVKCRLKELERDFDTYKKGNVWADPDIEDAAYGMRYVYDHPEVVSKIAQQGAKDIRRLLNPRMVGDQIKRRLELLVERGSAIQ